jgi:PEP-CTERM motif
MKRFVFLVAAACVCIASPAKADTITTFDVGGTLSDGATFSGTWTIDVTTGNLTTLDFAVTAPDSLTFSFLQGQTAYPTTGVYEVFAGTASSGFPVFAMDLPTPTLVGYQGGPIGSATQLAQGYYSVLYYSYTSGAYLVEGSLTPTPEPASLTLMSVGGVALLGYGWRRRRRAAE